MKNKRQIMVALFSREGHFFSQGQGHGELKHNDFLWSIIIRPKKAHGHMNHCYDVRHTEPIRRNQPHPVEYWQFRSIPKYGPLKNHRLLGQFMIGKIPHDVSDDEILNLLESIPLPRKDACPEENGVTWIKSAIRRLQLNDVAEKFDIDDFMDRARDHAIAVSHRDNPPCTMNYTMRRIERHRYPNGPF